MIDATRYIRLRFREDGREPPEVDCWGLYRLVVGDQTGTWLPDYAGRVTPVAIARTLRVEESGEGWIAVEPGQERPLDLVLMRGLIGKGRGAVAAPMHVGCVLDPGLMIDIEETTGVMVRAYRDTPRRPAMPTVVNRVLGVYRAAALTGGA